MSEIILPTQGKAVSERTWDKVYRYLQDEQNADRYLSRKRLLKVKEQNAGIGDKNMDGIGECYASMDSRMFHRQMQNDKHFWADEGNVKKFFKENPQYLNQTASGSTYKV